MQVQNIVVINNNYIATYGQFPFFLWRNTWWKERRGRTVQRTVGLKL